MQFVPATIPFVGMTDNFRKNEMKKMTTQQAIYHFRTEGDRDKRVELFNMLSRSIVELIKKKSATTPQDVRALAQRIVQLKRTPISRGEAELLKEALYDDKETLSSRIPQNWQKLTLSHIFKSVQGVIFDTSKLEQAVIGSVVESMISNIPEEVKTPPDVINTVLAEACELWIENPTFELLISEIKKYETIPIEPYSLKFLETYLGMPCSDYAKLEELLKYVPDIMDYTTKISGDPTKSAEVGQLIDEGTKELLQKLSNLITEAKKSTEDVNAAAQTKDQIVQLKEKAAQIEQLRKSYHSTGMALRIVQELCYLTGYVSEGNAIGGVGLKVAKGLFLAGQFYIAPLCPWTFCCEMLSLVNEISGYLSASSGKYEKDSFKYLVDQVRDMHQEISERFSRLEQNDIIFFRYLNKIDTNIAQVITDLSTVKGTVINAADQTYRQDKESKFETATLKMVGLLNTVTPTAAEVSDYGSEMDRIAHYARGVSWNPAFCGHVDNSWWSGRRILLEDITGILSSLVQGLTSSAAASLPGQNSATLPNLYHWAQGVYIFLALRKMTTQAAFLKYIDYTLVKSLLEQGYAIQREMRRLTSPETCGELATIVKQDARDFKECLIDDLPLVINDIYSVFKLLYPAEKIPRDHFFGGMQRSKFIAFVTTSYVPGGDIQKAFPPKSSDLFSLPTALVDRHFAVGGSWRTRYYAETASTKAPYTPPVAGILDTLKSGFISLTTGSYTQRWIGLDDRQDKIILTKGFLAGLSFTVTVYANVGNSKKVDVYNFVDCDWRDIAEKFAIAKGVQQELKDCLADLTTVNFFEFLIILNNYHIQALKKDLLANPAFKFQIASPVYQARLTKLNTSATVLNLILQLHQWCHSEEPIYHYPVDVQSLFVSQKDMDGAYARYILGYTGKECEHWNEQTITQKFREFLDRYFDEGINRFEASLPTVAQTKTLFFIDSAVNRLYGHLNVTWIEESSKVVPPALIPIQTKILTLRTARVQRPLRGVGLLATSGGVITQQWQVALLGGAVLAVDYLTTKTPVAQIRSLVNQFYRKSITFEKALDVYVASRGNLVVISFLVKLLHEDFKTTNYDKLLPIMMQIFELHTNNLMDYYYEIYLTFHELKIPEAELYLPLNLNPNNTLASFNHESLFRAWLHFINKQFADSLQLITELEKSDPTNWEVWCLHGMILEQTGQPKAAIDAQFAQASSLVNLDTLYTWRQIELIKSKLPSIKLKYLP